MSDTDHLLPTFIGTAQAHVCTPCDALREQAGILLAAGLPPMDVLRSGGDSGPGHICSNCGGWRTLLGISKQTIKHVGALQVSLSPGQHALSAGGMLMIAPSRL